MNPSIIIVGAGNIGQHIQAELASLHPLMYDPPKGIDPPEAKTTVFDFAFICVPTDSNPDGSADTSIVEIAVKSVSAQTIVIKSAVPVGTTNSLIERYAKPIVVSPEYYGTTQHSSESPDFLVLGGLPRDCRKVAQLYYRVKSGSFRIHFTDARTAELAKYMENCFLALKVTFCAEFAEIASRLGISYEKLREVFVMDPRMGDSHTFVYENKPYYDSHCLNKDVPALIAMAHDAPLMQQMHLINQIKKEWNHDN